MRKQTQRARQAANKAARSVADKMGEVDFRRIDPRKVELPKIDWERGRLVSKDAAPAIGHNFHAEDVAWPLRLVGWLVNRYIRLCEATTSLLVAGDGPFVQLQLARQPIIVLVWHGRNFQGIPMARLFLARWCGDCQYHSSIRVSVDTRLGHGQGGWQENQP